VLDSACSSGMIAIEHAYRAIRDGHCDSAIVGASNLLLHPYLTLQFCRLGALSRGGNSRPFDRDGMYPLSIHSYIIAVLSH
jgi:fatty acid synthase